MFIGEARGRNVDEIGRPLVGMAGKILDECLDYVGIV
jgi:uracil-DNA glycosylase family 4